MADHAAMLRKIRDQNRDVLLKEEAEAFDAGIAALSHAAGQEAVIPEGWTLVPKVPTQQMIDCGNDVADWGYQYSSQWPRDAGDGDAHEVYHAMLRAAPLVPAVSRNVTPPTTSAEVGRNSDRYLWLKENAPDAHMWSDESIDAAMAASSGRQGD